MATRIITNGHAHPIVYGFELTETERKDFDYHGASLDDAKFFRYRGEVYDLGEFMSLHRSAWSGPAPADFAGWDGYMSDSYFSGILVKYGTADDPRDEEHVRVATYIC